MGWQTDVITQLVFNKETYNSIGEIEEEINHNKTIIQNITDELLLMSTARPEDLLLHNEEMDLLGLQRRVKDNLEVFEECIIENYKLEYLKENFSLRDGDFIKNPERKAKTKEWLIKNDIFDKEDFNNKE
jgi:hypothetical protein